MLLPVVLLGLSLLCEASPVPLKVAVVGGGPGGSSAAFWLSLAKQRAPAGTSIDITVFEQESRVGGRKCTHSTTRIFLKLFSRKHNHSPLRRSLVSTHRTWRVDLRIFQSKHDAGGIRV